MSRDWRWKWNRKTVTITLPIDVAINLGATLNEWDGWTGWIDRKDCQNWKRSPIARENRRESIVYSNCLRAISAYLGRDGVREARRRAKEQTSHEET